MAPCCAFLNCIVHGDPAEQAVRLYLRLSYDIDPAVATELQGNRTVDERFSTLWFTQKAALNF